MTRLYFIVFVAVFALLGAIAMPGSQPGLTNVAYAQENIIAASKTPEAALRDVRARGVKAVPAAEASKLIGDMKGRGGTAEYKCGKAACMCVGSKSCGDLVASKKCGSGFHCLKTNEGPSCVCEQ